MLGAVVLVLAAVAAALYVTGRPPQATPMPASAPLIDAPTATWAEGKILAPTFMLTDQHGAPVSLEALRGRPVIITFIDPLCRDFCPIEAQHLNTAVNALPKGSKPAIVAVSVNIYGNARSILREDARKWKLVPEWRWGIGTHAALSRVWNAYHIEVLATTKTVTGVKVHTIVHTEGAYLIDAKGYERALFLWPYRAQTVVQTLRRLSS